MVTMVTIESHNYQTKIYCIETILAMSKCALLLGRSRAFGPGIPEGSDINFSLTLFFITWLYSHL